MRPLTKLKNFWLLIRYGKLYYGIHKKGEDFWYIGHEYYDGDHWCVHLGRFWIVYSERDDL